MHPEKELDEELMPELRVNLTQLRTRPVFRDLLVTLVGQAIVLASGLLVYRLAATYLAPNGVGEYALVRRANSSLQPLALLGLGVALQPFHRRSQPSSPCHCTSPSKIDRPQGPSLPAHR